MPSSKKANNNREKGSKGNIRGKGAGKQKPKVRESE